jgi:PDZ domain-containing protein
MVNLDPIGGPSPGLMFTLGVIDKLAPADLTGGRVIAGTGTVDDSGEVGPIGGIPLKLVAAGAAGPRCSWWRPVTAPRCSATRCSASRWPR